MSDTDHDLLAALAEAEQKNMHARPCQVCEMLAAAPESVKPALQKAIAGTIGRDTLIAILGRHGYNVGRRSLERHKREGHE